MHVVQMFIHPRGWWILGDVGVIVAAGVSVGLLFGSGAAEFIMNLLSSLIDD